MAAATTSTTTSATTSASSSTPADETPGNPASVTPSAEPDTRREQMLRAAAATIGERGFADTRITDVARRAGVSPALVIYYFGTKDQLLTEALRWSEDAFYAGVAAQLGEQRTARAELQLLVELSCAADDAGSAAYGVWGLYFDLWTQALRHPDVARHRVEIDRRWRAAIADLVRRGVASGEMTCEDPEGFALAFAALLDGLSIQVALRDPDVDSARATGLALGYARQALGVRSAARRR